jgi:hypothetical protein
VGQKVCLYEGRRSFNQGNAVSKVAAAIEASITNFSSSKYASIANETPTVTVASATNDLSIVTRE